MFLFVETSSAKHVNTETNSVIIIIVFFIANFFLKTIKDSFDTTGLTDNDIKQMMEFLGTAQGEHRLRRGARECARLRRRGMGAGDTRPLRCSGRRGHCLGAESRQKQY